LLDLENLKEKAHTTNQETESKCGGGKDEKLVWRSVKEELDRRAENWTDLS
jgi:hypothetical protein